MIFGFKIKEYWKPISGYANRYMISNHGRVKSFCSYWSKTGRIMKNTKLNTNYYQINLTSKYGLQRKYSVHRLVGNHFLTKKRNHVQINHKDGNGLNNHISNLEWCTRSENMIHSYRILGNKAPHIGKFGVKHPKSKKIVQKSKNGTIVKIWDSGMDAVRSGFDSSNISRCCNGEKEFYLGYIWEFKK